MQSLTLKTMIKLALWGWIVLQFAVEGSNVTVTLERYKREVPAVLSITYQNNTQIKTVFLLRILNTLISSTTPIYTTRYDPYHSYPRHTSCYASFGKYNLVIHKLNRVGEPILYHGIDSYSALTLFDYDRTLHGVLDHEFYIDGLPLHQSDDMNIVNKYIRRISKDMIPQMTDAVGNKFKDKESNNSDPHRASEYPNDVLMVDAVTKYPNTLYPEILVGVETLSPLTLSFDEFDKVYMYVVTYWNAVDMLLKKLKTVDIRINLSAIILGADSFSFPFVYENRGRVDKDGYNTIIKKRALNGLGKHFYKFLNRLDRESFDFMIFMTRARLFDPYDDIPDVAVVRSPASCGGMRREENRRKSIRNRAIIAHDGKFAEYQAAARVLTLLMALPDKKDKIVHRHDCCGLNSDIYGKCCELELRNYASSSYSCCLLNYPRSLPMPEPRKVITKQQQCNCYGLYTTIQRSWQMHDPILSVLYPPCMLPMACENATGYYIEVASRPLDGTPCDNNKYCYANKCI